jgi:hypothetical protein
MNITASTHTIASEAFPHANAAVSASTNAREGEHDHVPGGTCHFG